MKEYVERMKTEKAELEQRITKLLAFIESDKFAELDATEKRLLRMQYCGMETYRMALVLRLVSEDEKRYEGDLKALAAQADEWRKEGKTDEEIAAMCVERLQSIPAIGKEQIDGFVAAMSSGMLNC